MRQIQRAKSTLASLAIVAGMAVIAVAPASLEAQARPNIIFVFSDDHAAHALSAYNRHLAYGANLPATPNLDRLAGDGMLFVNAFVTNSICAPSRATVLTGQYGHLNGVMTNQETFHPTHTTFPRLLGEAGYETALVGKWHLKSAPAGFDHYEILSGQGPYYNPVLHSAGDSTAYHGYTIDVLTSRALDWVDGRQGDAPFLLMLQYNAVHRYWDPGPAQLGLYRDTLMPEPATFWDDGRGRVFAWDDPELTIAFDLFDRDLKLEAPAGLDADQLDAFEGAYREENEAYAVAGPTGDALTRWRYQRYITDYLRVVAAVDSAVGRVLEHLEASGLADNTLVVYTSDQGFFLGDHGWFDKRWMYEEALRTPLLVRWPGVVEPGSVNHDLVMNLDLAETFLDVAGVDAPASMQGESLAPLLRGEAPSTWRDAIYYQYFEYPGWHMVQRQHGVRTARYKLIHFYELDRWELFDLARDPDEMRSVYDDPGYADVVERLTTRLAELREQYAVPAEDPVPHEPFAPPPQFRRSGVQEAAGTQNAADEGASARPRSPEERSSAMAWGAHHLCAGLFVVGRDFQRPPDVVLARDIRPFSWFRWEDAFGYEVDWQRRRVRVEAPGLPVRQAGYHGDQGCIIEPRSDGDGVADADADAGGEAGLAFQPRTIASALPDARTQPWPTGDLGARGPLPAAADPAALDSVLDWAMGSADQNTRALVVLHGGRIVAERYAEGFGPHTPQLSWSQGKSIAAALVGVLVERGDLALDQPAPVAEWHATADDPRAQIRVRDLLHMSSGLDFVNLGLDDPRSYTAANEHFRIYMDQVGDVCRHAFEQPMDLPPDSIFRYRNSDPLALTCIVRRVVEDDGEDWASFAQRALFDRIGIRDAVLETDLTGTPIITGYDFMSAYDWARFGLLHLWDGVWQGERVLPEGWSAFVSTPTATDPGQHYGGLFWVNAGGRFPDLPRDAYTAAGFMGQNTMIVPSRDLVVVRLGPSPGGSDRYLNRVVAGVIEALGERAGPGDAEGAEQGESADQSENADQSDWDS